MAVHYSRDPRVWVRTAAAIVRPGGWLCVRTGVTETLSSYDFLRFFPTALAAERAAMPTAAELRAWFDTPEVEVMCVEEVPGGRPLRRIHALVVTLRRGFPSLQLVPRRELVRGWSHYALQLAQEWATGTPRPRELSVLLIARRLA